jgi:hypothetical protein
MKFIGGSFFLLAAIAWHGNHYSFKQWRLFSLD